METMEWPVAKPIFRTSTANHHLHGERSDRKREATSFEFFASLFADDCAVLFESHKDMVIGMDYMYQHFLKFGLEIHLGRGTAKSKTEASSFRSRVATTVRRRRTFRALMDLFPTRACLSTSAVILSPASTQLRRSRSVSRRRRKLLDASRRVRFGIRTSANSSKDESTLHSSCRFFYTDVRRGSCERRSTICCGAFISHA